MKRKFNYLGALLVLLFMVQGLSYGQNVDDQQEVKRTRRSSFSNYWYATLNFGPTMLWGDVEDRDFGDRFDSHLSYTGGISIGYQLHPVLGVRGNFQYLELQGLLSEPSIQQEMIAYSMFDYSLQGTVSLLNLIKVNEDRRTDVYGFAGVGFSNWKTKRREVESGILIERHGDVDGSNGPLEYTSELVVPFGFGVSFRITESFAIGLEQTWKWVNSDYLDAKDTGDHNDFYTHTTANLTWQFRGGSGIKKMVKNYEEVTIDADPEVLVRHGDKIDFTVKGNIPEDYFTNKAAMKIIPKLTYGDGKVKYLEPIYFRGEKTEGTGRVVTDEGTSFSKQYSVNWEDGMEDAELIAETLIYVPNNNIVNEDETNAFLLENTKSELVPNRTLAIGTITTGQIISFDPNIASDNPYSLNEDASYGMLDQFGEPADKKANGTATVYFRVNMSNLNWRLPLNRNNDAKEDVERLKSFLSQGWTIKNIEINAWASPEGEQNYNQRLSERRAETGRKLMQKLMKEIDLNYDDYAVKVNARGEDWNGFEEAVRRSNIADKDVILNVIRSNSDLKRREAEIRKMALVYRSIEKEILPMLRRTELAAITLEPKLSNIDLVDGAKTGSSSIQDEASYLYAATLVNDLNDKMTIYNNTIKNYPNSASGYNNLGYIYLVNGDYDKAKTSFEKAESLNPNYGVALNNLGVIYGLMDKDYDKAEEYFDKAQRNGVDASFNKGLINITKGNYSQALTQMGNRNCDYNVALAQLLSENYSKAKSTLECAPESAHKNYLMAVISARMNDKDNTFKYIVNTIKEDPKMADKIMNDKEFSMYSEMPEFKALFN